MSGFGAIVRWSGTPESSAVARLRSGIAFRGPDGVHTAELGAATLVHAQFVSTPEAIKEVQPTRHVRRQWWLAADARIDNRADLRALLDRRVEHPLQTDADFILAAYERWGEDLASHLVGDFAFAIWDAERERLLVARDQLGIRPAYWAATADGGFVASSTLRSTFEASGLQRLVNLTHLANFATFSGRSNDSCVLAGVQRLLAGHCLSVGADSPIRTWRYWAPPEETLRLDADSAAERVREAAVTAVECRLRAHEPIGVHLSGGFDSTTVAALARNAIGPARLHAYGLTFPGESCDETEYIKSVGQELGVQLTLFDATAPAPFDFFAQSRHSFDLPSLPDSGWSSPFTRLAVADGCRVILTGSGGDEVLYSDHVVVADLLIRGGRYREALAFFEATGYGARARFSGLLKSLIRAKAPGQAVELLARANRWSGAARSKSRPGRFLGPRISAGFVSNEDEPAHGSVSERSIELRRSLFTGSLSYFWEAMDYAAASDGVEYRHPFADLRLVELILRLEPAVLAADFHERGLHLRAFSDVIPEPIRSRRDKAEFTEAVVRAILPPATEVSKLDPKPLEPFIDLSTLNDVTHARATGSRRAGSTWDWWGAVAVAIWLESCPRTDKRPGVT